MTPCEKCPLYPQKEAGFFVPGQGDHKTARLIVIGEAPGENEAKQKLPFVGPAGRELHALLDPITTEGVYITNAVRCWPGEGNPEPPAKAVNLCREAYLDPELAESPAERVVTLGRVAAWALNHKLRKLTELIGLPYYYEPKAGIRKTVLSTWHPAAYLHSGKRQILVDIKRALQWGLRDGAGDGV